MTLQNRVLKMLWEIPWSRIRARKDEGLVKLLTNHKTWDADKAVFTQRELIDLVKDYNSADRQWRLLTARFPNLQGQDYSQKKVLMQKKVLDLDYEMDYNRLSKLSKIL